MQGAVHHPPVKKKQLAEDYSIQKLDILQIGRVESYLFADTSAS